MKVYKKFIHGEPRAAVFLIARTGIEHGGII